MTALGINVSNRERVTTHTPFFKTRTPLEIALIDARQEAKHAWDNYLQMVDVWVANKDYEKMDAEEEVCVQLDAKASAIYKQLNCDHQNHPSVEFDDHVVCTECGRKLLSGKRIV